MIELCGPRASSGERIRGLTPAVRDKLVQLAGRRMALARQRELLATP